MMMWSGLYFLTTSRKALRKSPCNVQQIHPLLISLTTIPESFKKPPSIPISPNSFSTRTTFLPAYTSLINFCINVVFPAPRKPEIISIFVISLPSFTIIISCASNSPNRMPNANHH